MQAYEHPGKSMKIIKAADERVRETCRPVPKQRINIIPSQCDLKLGRSWLLPASGAHANYSEEKSALIPTNCSSCLPGCRILRGCPKKRADQLRNNTWISYPHNVTSSLAGPGYCPPVGRMLTTLKRNHNFSLPTAPPVCPAVESSGGVQRINENH